MAQTALKHASYPEYLAMEATSAERHEWFDGRILAMAGGTEEHAFLIAAVLRDLGNALRGRPCRPTSSDLRIRSPETGLATYADAVVVCGKRIPHAEDKDACTNPTVLVEVLSPSTEAYDRGEKFEHYQTLVSLRDYVMIATGRNHVDHYSRNADGSWTLRSHVAGGHLTLSGVAVMLEVDAIYAAVDEVREAVA